MISGTVASGAVVASGTVASCAVFSDASLFVDVASSFEPEPVELSFSVGVGVSLGSVVVGSL